LVRLHSAARGSSGHRLARCAHGDRSISERKNVGEKARGRTVRRLPRRVARRLAPGEGCFGAATVGASRQATFVRTMPTCVGIVHPLLVKPHERLVRRTTVRGQRFRADLCLPPGYVLQGGTGDGLSACRKARPAERRRRRQTAGRHVHTRLPRLLARRARWRGSLGVASNAARRRGEPRASDPCNRMSPRPGDAFGTTRREVNRSRLSSVASFGNASRGKTEWTLWNADGSPSRAALSDRPVPARPSHGSTVWLALVADGRVAAESDRGIGRVHHGVRAEALSAAGGGQSPR